MKLQLNKSSQERMGSPQHFAQLVFDLLQRGIDVFCCKGEGNGTLLGGNWEEVNAKLDQLPAHLFVKTEIVMARQIVPIFWAMVHEIDTESRTLPGNYCLNAQSTENFFQAFLHFLSQRFDMSIHFPIIH